MPDMQGYSLKKRHYREAGRFSGSLEASSEISLKQLEKKKIPHPSFRLGIQYVNGLYLHPRGGYTTSM